VTFFAAKALYLTYTLVIPMFIHPPMVVIGFFVGVHLMSGLIFSLVFQLAHTVEGNQFPQPSPDTGHMEHEWSIHEVETTANFAPANQLVTWFCGGLNFQIEHHLAPRVCHIHYPDLSRIVRETCEESGIRYTSYPTVRSAIAMHYRFLKRLGASGRQATEAVA
jgi:linoleoyl-CoA desaturase